MKNKVKVTEYWRKGSRYIHPHLTKWQLFKNRIKVFFKVLIWGIVLVSVIFGIFEAGRYINPPIVYTKQEVIKEVRANSPIMNKIAKCESPTGHFGKNGQVAVNGNKNNSVDIGKYMINSSIWGAKATELGYNLWVEKDNEEMAYWIYENRGTEDWVWSKPCWNK